MFKPGIFKAPLSKVILNLSQFETFYASKSMIVLKIPMWASRTYIYTKLYEANKHFKIDLALGRPKIILQQWQVKNEWPKSIIQNLNLSSKDSGQCHK